MQVRLLGPVDVMVDGDPRPVRGLRRKAVLAVLALHGGEIVSTDQLTEAVWGQAAPPTAVNTIQSHMSYLRTVLGDKGAILARPPGYLLDLTDGGTDVREVERLLRQASQLPEPAEAVRRLHRAQRLWRGRPLADMTGVAWLEEQAERLDLLWLRVRQALSEARLAAGEHAQLVPELEQMTADHPLDERVHEQLMLALYRSGRQADALAVYHRLRHKLAEELGIDPGQALRGFLDALGVPVARIPADLDGQAGLYRSMLAGKRVLVVLDNARSAEQVRPLLPGSPGCLAVVTSRDQLAGLVATEGARPLALDLLIAADARELLVGRLGAARVTGEPDAVEAIIAACARLPLALTIAAARAATSPGFPLAAIAAELQESGSALDPFDGGDLATDVRAVFSWSYHALCAGAARLFRLLGLHPGPDVTVAAAASLAGIPPGQVRAVLGELTRAHLLAEHAPGRYVLHDLLRAYAGELARAEDSESDRQAAVHRVLDHYLHTAHSAAVAMEPFLYPITVGPPSPGTITVDVATSEAALDWFTSEQAVLLAAVRLAARAELGRCAWQLGWILSTYLLRCGCWDDQAAACHAALDAARRAKDLVGQAHMLHRLAAGYAKSGRIAESYPLYADALRLFDMIGDHASQASIHGSLGWLAQRKQRPEESLSHSLQSLELYQRAGHRAGQAMALKDVGFSHAMLGHHEQAIRYNESALAAMREMGEHRWEGAIWDSLGYAHHQRGDYFEAIACYERAIALSRDFVDRFNEADTLTSLGDVHHSAGDIEAARRAWGDALCIFDEIEHPDREKVRAKLHSPVPVAAVACR
jgi:DNA-binding SARP family transcriptional activator